MLESSNKTNNSLNLDKKQEKHMLSTLLRLAGYARKHWLKIVGAVAAVLISTGLGLLPPWLIRYGVDNLILAGEPKKLVFLGLIMVVSALIKGLFDFIKSYISEYIAQNIIHDLRVELYEHLNNLSFAFYDENRTGDLMSRLTADADSLRRFLAKVSVYVSSNLLTIGGILVVMLMWDYRLGLLYLLMMPLMIFGMIIYAIKVQPMFKKAKRKFAKLTHFVQENLAGAKVIKLFGEEANEEKEFERQNQSYIDIKLEAAKVSALWMPYVNFLMGLGTALVIWYGGQLVIKEVVSLGTLAGFVSYIALLLRPIRQTGMMINFSSQAVAAAERIFAVLDKKPEVKEAAAAADLPTVKGKVEFEDVSFSYEAGKEVLNNINLTAEPGDTIAVVGPTGAGKSTLLHLVPRFYDPDQGQILIGGYDIKNVKLDSLRQQVGIVLQNTFLFGASIKENISYGAIDAEMKEIIEAAKIAQIHEFIESLPLGYETPVGERGVTLSGGQKQRLAIARVLLTNPNLLILDEPTSNIDAETEDKMQQAMQEVIKERTTFVIAHRLWTVQNADQILVIKQGQIVESGTHQQLIKEDGFYNGVYEQVLSKDSQLNVDQKEGEL